MLRRDRNLDLVRGFPCHLVLLDVDRADDCVRHIEEVSLLVHLTIAERVFGFLCELERECYSQGHLLALSLVDPAVHGNE